MSEPNLSVPQSTVSLERWGLSPWILGVILLMAWAPLPFGSVQPVWKNALSATSLLMFAAFIITKGPTLRWPPHGNKALSWSLALFVLACLWIALQAAPFMPVSWHHPAWQLTAEALGEPLTGTISLDPAASIEDLLSLLGLAGIFGIVVLEARDPKKARALLAAAAVIAFAYAVYGLGVYLTGNETVAWAEKRFSTEALSASFVNRNTYGVYAGLGIVFATAMLLSFIAPILSGRRRRADKARDALAYITGPGGFWLLAIIVGSSALILSGSRAASAASALGILALVGLYLTVRRASVTIFVASFGAIAAAGFVLILLSGDLLFDRFSQSDGSFGSRSRIYEIVAIAIQDHFWLGGGYGAFDDVFRMYAGTTETFGLNFEAAHNVFLEMALELGAPAAVLLFASIALLFGSCGWAILKRRRDRVFPVLAISATVLVVVQGAVDFGIQTPAVALVFAMALGLGVAQATSSDVHK